MTNLVFAFFIAFFVAAHSMAFGQPMGHFTISLNDTMKYQTFLTREYYGIKSPRSLPLKSRYDNISDSLDSKTFYIDAGYLNNNSNTNFDFQIMNLSDTLLAFSQVYWIEPNFKPDVSPEPIAKGRSVRFRYTRLARERPGHFEKSTRINTSLGSFGLRFSGTILPPGIAMDRAVSRGTAVAGGSYHTVFRIYNHTEADLDIDPTFQLTQNTCIAGDDKEEAINRGKICAHNFRTFSITIYPQLKGRFVNKAAVVVNGTKVEHMVVLDVKPKQRKKK